MYWQPAMRKFGLLSAGSMNVLSSTAADVAPVRRVSEIVAGAKLQVDTPLTEYVNFTGMTPRFALNTLEPSELIGCWTAAKVDGKATVKSLNVFPVPVIGSIPTPPGLGSKNDVISKTNWLSSGA